MYDAAGELMSALSFSNSAWTPSLVLNERACVTIRSREKFLGYYGAIYMFFYCGEILSQSGFGPLFLLFYILFIHVWEEGSQKCFSNDQKYLKVKHWEPLIVNKFIRTITSKDCSVIVLIAKTSFWRELTLYIKLCSILAAFWVFSYFWTSSCLSLDFH